jgi:hypothetical protein
MRSASICLSQDAIRFQLAKFRLTISKLLILKSRNQQPIRSGGTANIPGALRQSRVADVPVRSPSDQAPLGDLNEEDRSATGSLRWS